MNEADSLEMSYPFLDRGFTLTENIDEADAVLVNTCTVRKHAEARALSAIGRLRQWREAREDRFLIVAGCAAERLGRKLRKRFPFVDLVVGARAIEDYPRILEAALSRRSALSQEKEPSSVSAAADSPVSAYLTISRGCSYACAYCIVPSVRGKDIPRSFDNILKEARTSLERGAKELILLGQTVNGWRDKEGRCFADLLTGLSGLAGLLRLRFMSAHPYFLDERLIDALARLPQSCDHLHLPVQSGSDRVLKAMRRSYTRALFLERTRRLRALRPELSLCTDLMVGFPGETEEDFKDSLSLVEEAGFNDAYCFKYSPREGTSAFVLNDPVPAQVKEERLSRILAAASLRRSDYLRSWEGRDVEVLLETPVQGRSSQNLPVRLDKPSKPGALVRARVQSSSPSGLRASLL